MTKRLAILNGLAAVLLLGGSILLLALIRSQATSIVTAPPSTARHSAIVPVGTTPGQPTPSVISGNPVSISIPSLNITLPITPGYYNQKTKQWTLTLDKAQYAVMTPEPNNQGGNTFIYGHYRKGVFATLHNIQSGAEAIVATDNGHTFYYQLNSIKVVTPEDSDAIFNYTGAPELTIQTCTGLMFQNRQLFSFSLEKVA